MAQADDVQQVRALVQPLWCMHRFTHSALLVDWAGGRAPVDTDVVSALTRGGRARSSGRCAVRRPPTAGPCITYFTWCSAAATPRRSRRALLRSHPLQWTRWTRSSRCAPARLLTRQSSRGVGGEAVCVCVCVCVEEALEVEGNDGNC